MFNAKCRKDSAKEVYYKRDYKDYNSPNNNHSALGRCASNYRTLSKSHCVQDEDDDKDFFIKAC